MTILTSFFQVWFQNKRARWRRRVAETGQLSHPTGMSPAVPGSSLPAAAEAAAYYGLGLGYGGGSSSTASLTLLPHHPLPGHSAPSGTTGLVVPQPLHPLAGHFPTLPGTTFPLVPAGLHPLLNGLEGGIKTGSLVSAHYPTQLPLLPFYADSTARYSHPST